MLIFSRRTSIDGEKQTKNRSYDFKVFRRIGFDFPAFLLHIDRAGHSGYSLWGLYARPSDGGGKQGGYVIPYAGFGES